MLPKVTTLYFSPTSQYVEAQMVRLTPKMAEQCINRDGWDSADLSAGPVPIGRHWDWNLIEIEIGISK
jgi:hypothetical protein